MPETYLKVQLPNDREEVIYSPSTIIKQYFEQASVMSLDDFQNNCSQALHHASNRVYERFGYECTSAMGELARVNGLVERIRKEAAEGARLEVVIVSMSE
ncbi:MSMEG_0570 family nitrogen starvation response protein [Dyadobacter sp. CY261]|uniref:MSMEG_0570 family nitrogen starvation response protein n=1 Tax=Dyadobacter sp. CY261 TaxID=2907203 RepID=UPI001F3B01E6|nr:MSMEG_0570 family nitrogen starvation response protein [Dyadobacter sp. CY261]MCF0072999.1 MSMEG_0570 family nitrogen starvation response protein [Dyadobacter sp. CY261]